jgi:5'-3' exonuclease
MAIFVFSEIEMGIPSYFKKLIDKVPGLVHKNHPGRIDWLWMDFNCLVYHCLRRPDMPPYPGEGGREEWEGHFLDEVARYSLQVAGQVNPQKGVYVAIDGVVPMAKMRQQRLRRFKSSWLQENGVERDTTQQVSATQQVWDTNAITPGTKFMERLRRRMERVAQEHRGWHVSSADEPGEGEHKIMDEWRKMDSNADHYAVYGLDADLIVLSMLNRELRSAWLFREEIDAGVVKRDSLDTEKYIWLNIDTLQKHIVQDIQPNVQGLFMKDYCFAMSCLGNDFLPSSLSFKIRDDGHDSLLGILREMYSKNIHLTDGTTVLYGGIKALVKELAKDEESRVFSFIHRKLKQRRVLEEGKEYIVGDPDWPLVKQEEQILLTRDRQYLKQNWQDIYKRYWFHISAQKDDICERYLYGMQWVWSYYNGNKSNVCYNWYYPWNLPPLWGWLAEYLEKRPYIPELKRAEVSAKDIRPWEQLCLVLPFQSWGLVEGAGRVLPKKAPWLFPSDFHFSTVGKRWFWEAEAEIPVPTIREVKMLLQEI